MTPFLKWAGGKRWLADSDVLPVPKGFDRYVEPFLGGGAVFFSTQPDRALLSDINAELIELYRVMRDHPEALQERLVFHQIKHCREYYYNVRDSEEQHDTIGRAARMLYLNRTCWNGLYRVNSKGRFNVPIGTKDTVIFKGESFEAFSSALKGAVIEVSDFEQTIDQADAGDFLFVDPPYTVKHNLNGFLKYNETIFSWADQIRLRDSLTRAVRRGVAVVATNADHASVRELYDSEWDYYRLDRFSVLAGSSAYRTQTSEAMFVANVA